MYVDLIYTVTILHPQLPSLHSVFKLIQCSGSVSPWFLRSWFHWLAFTFKWLFSTCSILRDGITQLLEYMRVYIFDLSSFAVPWPSVKLLDHISFSLRTLYIVYHCLLVPSVAAGTPEVNLTIFDVHSWLDVLDLMPPRVW